MDYTYWNEYYEKNIAPIEPTSFSKEVIKYLSNNRKLLELGCGNGRDAVFFAKNKIDVVAIDQSEAAINVLKNYENLYDNITFIKDDFVNSDVLNNRKFDYIYSRFTLHSITEDQQRHIIKKVYNTLEHEGMFFIEARSINDSLYGKGEKIGDNEYIYNSHYRRFINIDELTTILLNEGFTIEFANESDEYAVYKDEKPMVIRVIAKK